MSAQIYSIGDGQFLTSVIDSMALITQSSSFTILSATGFIIGVLWVGVQGVMSGGREFKIQNIFIAVLTWMVFFGSTTDAVIEDVKTSQVRVVANVPVGIAYTGEVVSIIGHGLTELFEQAFTTPSMYDGGYAKQLRVIGQMERMTLGAANTSAANGGDRLITMINYMNDCFIDGIATNQIQSDIVLKAPNLLDAIQYGNVNKSTKIFLPNGPTDGEIFDCPDAYLLIKDDLLGVGSNFPQRIYDHLNGVLKIEDSQQYLLDMLNGNALTPFGATPIQYIINSFINQHINDAIEARSYAITGVNRYEIMMKQAIEQRNVQWSADKNLFVQTSSSLMTFFEAVMYAVAPFLAFIIALGPSGFGLAAQYLKFAIWIQLWGPIIAIINFYILSAFSGRMDALSNDQNINAFSIEGLSVMSASAADWLAIGSLFVASTPAITLMLLFGGVHTAVALSDRMRGSDHVRESIAARDKYATAPMVTDLGGAQFTKNSPMTVTGTTGVSSVQKMIGGANTHSNSSAVNAREVESNKAGYTQGVTSLASMSQGDQETALKSTMLSKSNGHQISNAASNTIETARGMINSLGVDDNKKDAATTIVGAGLRASAEARTPAGKSAVFQKMVDGLSAIGVGGFGIGGDVSGQVNSKHEEGRSTSAAFKSDFMTRTGNKGAFTTSHSDAINQDRKEGVTNAYTTAATNNDSAAFSKIKEKTSSKEDSLSQQQSVTNTMGTTQSIPVGNIGAQYKRGNVTDAAVSEAGDVITSSGLAQTANTQTKKFSEDHPVGKNDARGIGAIAAMTAAHVLDDAINSPHFKNRPNGAAEEQRAVAALNTLFSQATGNTSQQYMAPSTVQSENVTPKSSSDFEAGKETPNALQKEVENKTQFANNLSSSGGEFALDTFEASDTIKNSVATGDSQIAEHTTNGNEEFKQKSANNNSIVAGATKSGYESLPAEGVNVAGTISDNTPNPIASTKQFGSYFSGGDAGEYAEIQDQFNDKNVQPRVATLAGIVATGYVPEEMRSDTFNDLNKGYEAKQEAYQMLGFGSRENGESIEPSPAQLQTYNNFKSAVNDKEWQTADNIYTQSRGQDDISGDMNNLSEQMTK